MYFLSKCMYTRTDARKAIQPVRAVAESGLVVTIYTPPQLPANILFRHFVMTILDRSGSRTVSHDFVENESKQGSDSVIFVIDDARADCGFRTHGRSKVKQNTDFPG